MSSSKLEFDSVFNYKPIDRGKVKETKIVEPFISYYNPKGLLLPPKDSYCSHLVINLAEEVQLRDRLGHTQSILALHDGCSDSSWVSSDLACSFPLQERKRVTVPLQTINDTSSFDTYEYSFQILAGDRFKMIKLYYNTNLCLF